MLPSTWRDIHFLLVLDFAVRISVPRISAGPVNSGYLVWAHFQQSLHGLRSKQMDAS
jgi:hypothetical protein